MPVLLPAQRYSDNQRRHPSSAMLAEPSIRQQISKGRDLDAFPESGWVVVKMLDATAGGGRKITAHWAPWRA